MRIILPRTYCDEAECLRDPIFFFAGPILGGGDWQRKCFDEIGKHLINFTAVIPCKYGSDHDLMVYKVSGDEGRYSRQTLWERRYLRIAATNKNGCLIFWLPCESKDNPRQDGSPYARDTYGELGEWRGRMMQDPKLHIVIGAEVGFRGLSQIQANFNDALQREFCIYTSLQETVRAAVNIVSR